MSELSYSPMQLKQLVAVALDEALGNGASSAEAEVSEAVGQSVSVRLGEIETIEYNRDKSFGITVYIGQQKGNASSSHFAPAAIRDTVLAAMNIARFTAQDGDSGLVDKQYLCRNDEVIDCDLHHPWDLSVEAATRLAQICEAAALESDTRIQNSEGATVHSQQSQFIYANTNGFNHGYASSRHSLSCSVIAGKEENMQRDYWSTQARAAQDLREAKEVGKIAASRTLRRLDARTIASQQVPVLFEAPIARSLIGHLVAAVSGGALYRKNSFLLNSLHTSVAAPCLQISERAHLRKGMASAPFDNEGVLTKDREWVSDGILNGYFLGSYSARKLGMTPTGHAGGAHNLIVQPTHGNLADLIKSMGRGVLVTELLGQGVNLLTGDYSRGAAGFWVEHGMIQYPIEEITIAGNLRDMLQQIVAIGNDILPNTSCQCGSILIERMSVAGAS